MTTFKKTSGARALGEKEDGVKGRFLPEVISLLSATQPK
jgi:hypothetical protein